MKHPVVFFDAHCLFCNRFVQLLIFCDKKKKLRYAPLGGRTYQNLGLPSHDLESVVFFHEQEIYLKSAAIFQILRYLGYPWRLAVFFVFLPRSWLDFLYDFVAKNRYLWGRARQCLVEKDLFLD